MFGDRRIGKLEKAYRKLRPNLPQENGEVKGRLLNEKQVDSVVSILHEHSAVFAAIAIDLSYHTKANLQAFQKAQGEKITANIKQEHAEALKKQAREYQAEFGGFSMNLMVQTMLTFDFLPRLLQQSVSYFAMRRPEELSSFHWVIDAKGNEDVPHATLPHRRSVTSWSHRSRLRSTLRLDLGERYTLSWVSLTSYVC